MSKGLLAPQIQKVRGLELSIEEIRQAKDELIRMSNDSTQRQLYDIRANSLMGKISQLYEVERKDIEKTASTKLTVSFFHLYLIIIPLAFLHINMIFILKKNTFI